MSVVVQGRMEDIENVRTVSFFENPMLRAGREDRRLRTSKWIRSVILHTTLGEGHSGPGGDAVDPPVKDTGRSGLANRTIENWRNSRKCSSSHLVIDGDGTVLCTADLAIEVTFHATSINEVSIGIEICQDPQDHAISKVQLKTLVLLCDWISSRFGIQRQMHWPYLGGPVKRLSRGGESCVGFFGHRDQTENRGRADPGNDVMFALGQAGYEQFDFETEEDLMVWKRRQKKIGVAKHDIDGIPGPKTRALLRASGKPYGLWVER